MPVLDREDLDLLAGQHRRLRSTSVTEARSRAANRGGAGVTAAASVLMISEPRSLLPHESRRRRNGPTPVRLARALYGLGMERVWSSEEIVQKLFSLFCSCMFSSLRLRPTATLDKRCTLIVKHNL